MTRVGWLALLVVALVFLDVIEPWVAVGLGVAVLALLSRRGREGAAPGAPPGAPRQKGAGQRPPRPSKSTARTSARLGVADLARWLGVTEAELTAATPRYATFVVPKRRREAGVRTIRAPDAPTKALQRRVLRRVLGDRLRAHPAVHGFQWARSIATNAKEHAGRAVVVSIDLREFFASTAERRVRRFFRVIGWDREAAHILSRLTTLEGGLPQGAPTSPRLANLVNVGLDERLNRLARRNRAAYTRYADDLTFSWVDDDPRAVRRLIGGVRRIVGRDGYELNDRKVRVMRRHQRQLVTGLVVNVQPQLPRSRRRWLRSVEHHLRTGRPATLTTAQLRGWNGLELMISSQAAVPAAGSTPPERL